MKPIQRQPLPIMLALSAIVFALSFSVEAQQPKKVARIGYLSSFDLFRDATRLESLRRALRELGYIEGSNIAYEYRYGDGQRARYVELAAELVRLQVDIIIAAGGTVEAARGRGSRTG